MGGDQMSLPWEDSNSLPLGQKKVSNAQGMPGGCWSFDLTGTFFVEKWQPWFDMLKLVKKKVQTKILFNRQRTNSGLAYITLKRFQFENVKEKLWLKRKLVHLIMFAVDSKLRFNYWSLPKLDWTDQLEILASLIQVDV